MMGITSLRAKEMNFYIPHLGKKCLLIWKSKEVFAVQRSRRSCTYVAFLFNYSYNAISFLMCIPLHQQGIYLQIHKILSLRNKFST